ncbi:nicotinamide riboside transporter PnuC [Legionella jordanis]|uniref:nicotinamide riboside transporter PnuC n=1 Tax=Legionella jordanis TaxID=456 RepID=UPI000F006866|nr:nicotinamide riboside transporter PnuC [Legionella jordanis]RMX15574.1 nicotinamide riboside transporter PnuC [Legionella jordanis]HAT8714978.1 nicotinamide riboside transporter PnuC [Legionella jordanis]
MLLDVFGALLSLVATYYFIRISSKAWTASLLAIILNMYLYWQKGIYADSLLEGFYFFSTCYGLYRWVREGNQQSKTVVSLSLKQNIFLVMATSLIFLLIALFLMGFTQSDVVILDALTTALSLVAQGLMCYKIIQTWLLWLITDSLYAYMYLKKDILFHSGLMLLYTIMAIVGYYSWKKQQLDSQKQTFTAMDYKKERSPRREENSQNCTNLHS